VHAEELGCIKACLEILDQLVPIVSDPWAYIYIYIYIYIVYWNVLFDSVLY